MMCKMPVLRVPRFIIWVQGFVLKVLVFSGFRGFRV